MARPRSETEVLCFSDVFSLFLFICLIDFTLYMSMGKDSREDNQKTERALVLQYPSQVKLLGNSNTHHHLQLERTEHRIQTIHFLQKYYIRPQSFVLTAETPNSPLISLFSIPREGYISAFTEWRFMYQTS